MSARDDALARVAALPAMSLAEIEAAAALRVRSDVKYLVGWEEFRALLGVLAEDHAALEIDGRRDFLYHTTYFDSADLSAFRAHVQGRRRRYKVRVREYADSQFSVLELKLKGRRGETVKHRVPHTEGERLGDPARAFLREHLVAAYGEGPPEDLSPVVRTTYRRLTLAAPGAEERLTVDFDLVFPSDGVVPALSSDHVIVEAKSRDGRGRADRALRDLGARPVACSKYVVGVGLTGRRPTPHDLRRLTRRYFTESVSPVS